MRWLFARFTEARSSHQCWNVVKTKHFINCHFIYLLAWNWCAYCLRCFCNYIYNTFFFCRLVTGWYHQRKNCQVKLSWVFSLFDKKYKWIERRLEAVFTGMGVFENFGSCRCESDGMVGCMGLGQFCMRVGHISLCLSDQYLILSQMKLYFSSPWLPSEWHHMKGTPKKVSCCFV